MKSFFAFCLSAIALSAANPASNMKLAFSDEFDGPALDAAKWATQGEPTAITTFKTGKITGVRITLIKKEDMIQTNGIHTRGKFEQVRGYFEASMRMNGYKGHGGTMSLRGADDKAVALIQAMAPEHLDAFKTMILGVAKAMAEAVDGTSEKESDALDRIRGALEGQAPA